MSTEIPVLYNEIKKQFDTALKNAADGEYVEKPKSLYRYSKLRRNTLAQLQSNNLAARKWLTEKSSNLVSEYGISSLEATNIVLEIQATENNLKEQGVYFGNEVFNFAIDRPVISNEEKEEIINNSNLVMENLINLGKSDLRTLLSKDSLFPTEVGFENNLLLPNAARIDMILTDKGPKVIEVNSQWVDAINALSGFSFVYGDLKTAKTIIEKFVNNFPQNSSLALVNILQTSGSRELGATKELESLAFKILQTRKLKRCEVVDPNKVRLSYLKDFSNFYLNFDPKAIGYSQPDWMEFIISKSSQNPKASFPAWRPLLDSKRALTMISNTGYMVPTTTLNNYKGSFKKVILKGDGYSLNSVVSSVEPGFEQSLNLALKEPLSYVVQPFLESKRFSCWVYDSSSKKIKFIKDGYTKLNVWWLNGEVVGMLMTVSELPLISDKGYNTYPIFKP